jgi:hypothetical protein
MQKPGMRRERAEIEARKQSDIRFARIGDSPGAEGRQARTIHVQTYVPCRRQRPNCVSPRKGVREGGCCCCCGIRTAHCTVEGGGGGNIIISQSIYHSGTNKPPFSTLFLQCHTVPCYGVHVIYRPIPCPMPCRPEVLLVHTVPSKAPSHAVPVKTNPSKQKKKGKEKPCQLPEFPSTRRVSRPQGRAVSRALLRRGTELGLENWALSGRHNERDRVVCVCFFLGEKQQRLKVLHFVPFFEGLCFSPPPPTLHFYYYVVLWSLQSPGRLGFSCETWNFLTWLSTRPFDFDVLLRVYSVD